MNDDYLWDKSGTPDPEVQQLEEILGTLRYQPRELVIPPMVHAAGRNFVYRGLAIAAAIALVVFGVGLRMSTNMPKQIQVATTEVKPAEIQDLKVAAAGPDEKKLSGLLARTPGLTDQSSGSIRTNTSRRHKASAERKSRSIQTNQPELSASEIAEARAAKDQLMLALRLASTKLSLAQKRMQPTSTENEIHNQHKAG